jgi:hypothetical protein
VREFGLNRMQCEVEALSIPMLGFILQFENFDPVERLRRVLYEQLNTSLIYNKRANSYVLFETPLVVTGREMEVFEQSMEQFEASVLKVVNTFLANFHFEMIDCNEETANLIADLEDEIANKRNKFSSLEAMNNGDTLGIIAYGKTFKFFLDDIDSELCDEFEESNTKAVYQI